MRLMVFNVCRPVAVPLGVHDHWSGAFASRPSFGRGRGWICVLPCPQTLIPCVLWSALRLRLRLRLQTSRLSLPPCRPRLRLWTTVCPGLTAATIVSKILFRFPASSALCTSSSRLCILPPVFCRVSLLRFASAFVPSCPLHSSCCTIVLPHSNAECISCLPRLFLSHTVTENLSYAFLSCRHCLKEIHERICLVQLNYFGGATNQNRGMNLQTQGGFFRTFLVHIFSSY